jgi:L-iditol 2-dehydrogenase
MSDQRMQAARLHGAMDLRIEYVPAPHSPKRGEVLLRIKSTGICGSDLHSYKNGCIGNTRIESPLIPGHEFSAVVELTGEDCFDGNHRPIIPGSRVAVDPAIACGHCEFCAKGHPNLCCKIRFCGLWPDAGSLSEFMVMPAKNCFPIPDGMSDEEGSLLEPLGVALHALALSKIRLGECAAILGAGPIGLLILQLARLCGASPIIVTDPLPWRLELARRFGADFTVNPSQEEVVSQMLSHTEGRGCDVIWEAAWGTETVAEAAEAACLGGRVILVGIPEEDKLEMKASSARRKGLTIKMVRRMKHTYPTAIRLVSAGKINLLDLVSHRFPLSEADKAFRLNLDYTPNSIKVMINC